MDDRFQTYYWGDNQHTMVHFRPFTEIPADVQPTVSMVFAQNDEGILLSRPPRGWGLPGGHIERGETPEIAAVREVYEETNVVVDDLRLVGGWLTKKQLDTDETAPYPDRGVMLLYVGNVRQIDDFVSDFETLERCFAPRETIREIHDGRSDFYAVMDYILESDRL